MPGKEDVIKLPFTPEQEKAFRDVAEADDGTNLEITVDLGKMPRGAVNLAGQAVLAGVSMAAVREQKKLLGLKKTHLLTLEGPACRVATVALVIHESFERVDRYLRGEEA